MRSTSADVHVARPDCVARPLALDAPEDAPHVAAPGAPVLTFAVCDGIDEADAEWEALADRTRASPFLRPGWMRIWQTHFSTRPVKVLVVRRRERVAALVPFVHRRRTLASPTNFHTPEFGALAEDAAAAAFLFDRLLSLPHDAVSLAFVEQGGWVEQACLAAAARLRHRTLVRVQQQAPFVTLEGRAWSAIEAQLGGKLRADLRRRARRLADAGRVTLEVSDGRDRLDQLLSDGFGVEPSGWKRERGSAITSRAQTEGFYRDAARWAATRGVLRLAFLRLDGRAVAFQFGVEEGGVYYLLKGGYEPSFHACAPGKLLAGRMIARACELGLRRFEFLGTSEPWKREWASGHTPRVAVSAFAPSPLGLAGWAVHRYGRPAAAALKARVRRAAPE